MAALRMRLHQHIQPEYRLQRLRPQHLCRCVQRMGPAILQQQDAITIARRQVQVVKDHQHRRATVGKAPDRLLGGVLVQRVKH